MADDVAASLVDALADEGEEIDAGRFTLDPARARLELREHQLDEPAAYVLLVVEAAHLASEGRGPVVFELGSESSASFVGPCFTADQLRDPFSAVFMGSEGLEGEALRALQVLRLLGLAANAALAGRVDWVEIENVDAEGRHHVVRLTRDDSSASSPRAQTQPGRTVFRVHGGIFAGGRPSKEQDLLEARCELASMAIVVEGERVDRGPLAAFAGYRKVETTDVVVDELGIVGKAARLARAEPATLRLVTRSVLSESVTLDHCRPGFVAVVELDLRKDLSQRRVLRDERFAAVQAAVDRAHARLPWAAQSKPGEQDSEGWIAVAVVLLVVLPVVVIALLAMARSWPAS